MQIYVVYLKGGSNAYLGPKMDQEVLHQKKPMKPMVRIHNQAKDILTIYLSFVDSLHRFGFFKKILNQ